MKIKANAKINLSLNVVNRRNDGYHTMHMIMVPISLADEITINFHDCDEYICNHSELVMDQNNTIIKAVQLMRETFQIEDKFKIEIEKNIPMQAGLAGGSADAAAVMKAIVKMKKLDVSVEQLANLGKKIGADVPFCIYNQCAIVQGIGEKIELFSSKCNFYVLLVKPKEGVSTKEAFQQLNLDLCAHSDIDQCKKALEENNAKQFYRYASNSLEQSAMQILPKIQEIKNELFTIGFPFVLMSGSGSCVFALTEDKHFINQVYNKMNQQYEFVYVGKCL